MGKLEEDLPKITKKVLHEEDKITKGLVKTLLAATITNQTKSDPYPTIRNILDSEIEKSFSVGLFDFEDGWIWIRFSLICNSCSK